MSIGSADLATIIADAHTYLLTPYDAIAYKIGRLEVEQNRDYPCYYWVPSGGRFAPTVRAGGNPIACATLETDCEVLCWGQDLAQAETMMRELVAACWRRDATSVQFGAMKWLTQVTPDYAKRGEIAQFTVTWRVPVIAEIKSTVVIAEQAVTGTITAGT